MSIFLSRHSGKRIMNAWLVDFKSDENNFVGFSIKNLFVFKNLHLCTFTFCILERIDWLNDLRWFEALSFKSYFVFYVHFENEKTSVTMPLKRRLSKLLSDNSFNVTARNQQISEQRNNGFEPWSFGDGSNHATKTTPFDKTIRCVLLFNPI